MTRLVLIIAVILTAGLALARPALSHEHWINRENLHDPVSRAWCCDETDCFPQPAGAVVPAPGGFKIEATGELIARERVIWRSPDGKWWRCGALETRCLIGPPNSF